MSERTNEQTNIYIYIYIYIINTSNNTGNWNHFKIIQKISGPHRPIWTARYQATAILGIAHVLREVLM